MLLLFVLFLSDIIHRVQHAHDDTRMNFWNRRSLLSNPRNLPYLPMVSVHSRRVISIFIPCYVRYSCKCMKAMQRKARFRKSNWDNEKNISLSILFDFTFKCAILY